MIVAEIYKQDDGKIIGFSVDGHSNQAKHGYDIYCSAASMISSSVFLCLRDFLKRDFEWDAAHGRLMVKLKDEPDDLTEAVFQTMLIGLKLLEEDAPKIFKIEMIEPDKAAEAILQNKGNDTDQSREENLPKLNVRKVKIRANIYRNEAGKISGFSIEEHDTKSIKEFKIYRAAVWALVSGTFACIRNYLKCDMNFGKTPRRLKMQLKNSPDEITEAVLQTMLIGLIEVQKKIPQVIKVNENFPAEVKINDFPI